MILVFTHLAAAIIPLLAIFLWFRIKGSRGEKQYLENFWRRQSKTALEQIDFWQIDEMPEPLHLITERDTTNMALQTVAALQELGLFRELARRSHMTEAEIIAFLGFPDQRTQATLTLLTASKVIKPHANGFQLTEQARIYLLKDSPFFTPLHPPVPPREFIKSLRGEREKGARVKWAQGQSFEPERIAMQQHMHSFALGFALSQSNLLKDATRIFDVAGGAGSVCIALAMSNPDLEITMAELPGSVPAAEKMVGQYNQSERITCVGLDMFNDKWPQENDAILFTNIFHDWSEARCHTLAKKAYEALKPGGVIMLQEALLEDDDSGPMWTAHMSMTLALFTEGRQFHVTELKTLLAENGFADIEVHPLLGYYATVIGVKPN